MNNSGAICNVNSTYLAHPFLYDKDRNMHFNSLYRYWFTGISKDTCHSNEGPVSLQCMMVPRKWPKGLSVLYFFPFFRLKHCYISHRLTNDLRWQRNVFKTRKKAILLCRQILWRFTTVSNILSQMWSRPYKMSLRWILEAFKLFADIKVTLIELYFWCQYQSKFTYSKLQLNSCPYSVISLHQCLHYNYVLVPGDFFLHPYIIEHEE